MTTIVGVGVWRLHILSVISAVVQFICASSLGLFVDTFDSDSDFLFIATTGCASDDEQQDSCDDGCLLLARADL